MKRRTFIKKATIGLGVFAAGVMARWESLFPAPMSGMWTERLSYAYVERHNQVVLEARMQLFDESGEMVVDIVEPVVKGTVVNYPPITVCKWPGHGALELDWVPA